MNEMYKYMEESVSIEIDHQEVPIVSWTVSKKWS